MGEFNNRHLNLITYSSIYDAKTILDLYTDNINKNLRMTYIPFCYLKSLKIKQKNPKKLLIIDKDTNLEVSPLLKNVIFTPISKVAKKHFNVIRLLLNIK